MGISSEHRDPRLCDLKDCDAGALQPEKGLNTPEEQGNMGSWSGLVLPVLASTMYLEHLTHP